MRLTKFIKQLALNIERALVVGRVIFPPELARFFGPTIFLAGPIKGAPRWQDWSIEYLQVVAPWLNIASPRRSLDRAGDYTEQDYISQVDWESLYLRRAARNGVIVFWFAKEQTHYCDRPFARTTRIEFGEWLARHELTRAKIVVGFEPGFDGHKYIRQRLEHHPEVPICDSLLDTLDAAIAQASRA